MAFQPRLARPTVRCQDQKKDALSEARETACRAVSAAWRCIYWTPRTAEGLARLTAARTTHGKYTKEKRAEAKRRAEVGRQMRGELKELET